MKLKSIVCTAVAMFLMAVLLLFVALHGGISYAKGLDLPTVTDKLPSEYCLRDDYVVLAQNQDKHGFCWNFAATMAASTTIMKATGEYYDFSELWTGIALLNCNDNFKKMGQGGGISHHYESMKQSGLMLETDLPYQYSYTATAENAADYYNFYEQYSCDNLARCLVTDQDTRFSKGDVEDIKRHIYEHGSVYMTFSFSTGFVESDGAYYLEPNQKTTSSNHAVSVIGWDDNYEKEFYLDGSDTPTVFRGAWIILNSYTEKSGNDGISFVFYNDNNIGTVQGYRYEADTSYDLYFYDKIESGYAYPNSVVGKYYGDFTSETGTTKQKNIFYDSVSLEYSYVASSGAGVKAIDIYLDGRDVTDRFDVAVDNEGNRFFVSADTAAYGQYKLQVTYGTDSKTDTYLNNFFVTHGLVGEEIEYDADGNDFAFNPGYDVEFYSFVSSDKTYVIYTDKLQGEIAFLPTEQSVYSEKNMSLPRISYEITNGKSCSSVYKIESRSGYELEYKFIFEYCADTSLQTVNVYYDLGGGENHSENYALELAGPTGELVLYAPTREGYTFAGWYLDYGNGSRAVEERDGLYYVSWDDIHHCGENPSVNAISYYKEFYNNSNTLFLYARWEEEAYYTVELTIDGEGSSQITEPITVCSDDAVRYLLIPASGGCLSELEINGEAVSSDALVEIMKSGLLLESLDRDISVVATFSQGVYLSLKFGDGVKNAYVVGTKDGETARFYNGDYIPYEYFSDDFNRVAGIKVTSNNIQIPSKSHVITIEGAKKGMLDTMLPSLLLPFGYTEFTLVVELYDSKPGYTRVLSDVSSYCVEEGGIFKKGVTISKKDVLKEIDVGSADEKPVEKVEISYSVNNYVTDHYVSSDKNATFGNRGSATYDSGQIVYLFIRVLTPSPAYDYRVPSSFEPLGNQWYRKAVFVNADDTSWGTVQVYRESRTYLVTWKNWDDSVIYSQKYLFGATPVFNDKSGESPEQPIRPADERYTYVFSGWDKTVSRVNADVTYTATYEAIPKQYVICITPTEHGTVTPGEDSHITYAENRTYLFTPDPWYVVKDVKIDGASIGRVESYTFSQVVCDHTLAVEYELDVTLVVLASSGAAVLIAGIGIAVVLIIRKRRFLV